MYVYVVNQIWDVHYRKKIDGLFGITRNNDNSKLNIHVSNRNAAGVREILRFISEMKYSNLVDVIEAESAFQLLCPLICNYKLTSGAELRYILFNNNGMINQNNFHVTSVEQAVLAGEDFKWSIGLFVENQVDQKRYVFTCFHTIQALREQQIQAITFKAKPGDPEGKYALLNLTPGVYEAKYSLDQSSGYAMDFVLIELGADVMDQRRFYRRCPITNREYDFYSDNLALLAGKRVYKDGHVSKGHLWYSGCSRRCLP